MRPSVDVNEFLEGFLTEAEEHLHGITVQLSSIDEARDRPNPRAVRELFRSLHTLKGLAGMMGVDAIVLVAHAMESVVRVADKAGGLLPADSLDPLILGARTLEQCVRALAANAAIAAPPESLLSALDASVQATAHETPERGAPGLWDKELAAKLSTAEQTEIAQALASGEFAYAVEFIPSPARADTGLNITAVRERIGRIGRIVRVLPQSVARSEVAPGGLKFVLIVISSAPSAELAAAAGGHPAAVTSLTAPSAEGLPAMAEVDVTDELFDRGARRDVVRVDVERLDETMEHVAALGVCRARLVDELKALAERGTDVRVLRALLDENARHLRRMRQSVLGLRMVPLRDVLEPLPLIVRGLRNRTGKNARLRIEVGQTELDKAVAERVFPALVHLVRNAFDHGVEAPGQRRASGKPEEGTIRVDALAQSSTHLSIEVSDDGAGIDAARVAARAGRELPPDDTRLLEILTLPGFSLRDTVSTTSGRGLGMDIVQKTVEALGGELTLRNRPGHGTSFRLRVPLTVAMIDAFSFEAGAQKFLVPVTMVDEIVEVEPDAITSPPRPAADAGVDLMRRRGESMPLVSLFRVLDRAGRRARHDGGREPKAIVVRRLGEPYAFGVERMLGKHEVLVRPLTDPLAHAPGISGSADLGDGRPTLVVDLLGLTATLSVNPRELQQ
jgi:two-component system, chemotaxis family, sensor kinase CheA